MRFAKGQFCSPQSWKKLYARDRGCATYWNVACSLQTGLDFHQRPLGASFLLPLCCNLQAPTIMADLGLLDPKIPRPKKLLFLARCSLHSADRRSRRGGAASQTSDTSPRVPEQLALCRLLRISKNKVPNSFLPWAGPETWNVPCQRLGQLWAKSQPELPVKCGVHSSPWSEFALVDPGHGMETLRPMAALEETDLLEKPVSPSKTMRPAPWTLLFMAGTLPHPQHHTQVFRSRLSGCC